MHAPAQTRYIYIYISRLGIYDASAYDGVFYVGGFGTMWDFPESPVNNIYILQDFSSNLIFSHS